MNKISLFAFGCMAISSCSQQTVNESAKASDSTTVADTLSAVPSHIEDIQEKTVKPLFAIINEETTDLLVKRSPDKADEVIENPEKYVYAIYGQQLNKIEYVGIQKENATENNDRDTPYNFPNLPGYRYKLKDGRRLSKEETFLAALLVDEEFAKNSKVLKTFLDVNLPAKIKAELESRYKRKIINVADCEKLGEDGLYTFFAVQFENKGNDALGVIGLVDKAGKMYVKDFPEKYDETSTWHVDDGGEFIVNFREAIVIDGKINLIVADCGGESTNMNNLEIVGDSLKNGNISINMYQAPL